MNASQRNIVWKFPELLIKLRNTSHLSLVKTFPAAQIYKLPIFTSIGDRYRKIPKTSPRAYIFQRPFFRGLFLEGLIFGGAYVRREICVSKSIGLACSGKEIYHFCFVLLLYSRANSKYKPPRGAYIWRGDLTEGFYALRFWGAYNFIWRSLFSEFYGIVHSAAGAISFFQHLDLSTWPLCVRIWIMPLRIWSPKSVAFNKAYWGCPTTCYAASPT